MVDLNCMVATEDTLEALVRTQNTWDNKDLSVIPELTRTFIHGAFKNKHHFCLKQTNEKTPSFSGRVSQKFKFLIS